MRRFSFRLESVRRLREDAQTTALVSLARELQQHAGREEQFLHAEHALGAARQAVASDTVVTGRDLAYRQAYLERRERERLAARLQLEAGERELAARRAEWEQAAAEVGALDKLREKQLEAHRRKVARSEADQIAEASLVRYVQAGAA